jgi:hypothetical protein
LLFPLLKCFSGNGNDKSSVVSPSGFRPPTPESDNDGTNDDKNGSWSESRKPFPVGPLVSIELKT